MTCLLSANYYTSSMTMGSASVESNSDTVCHGSIFNSDEFKLSPPDSSQSMTSPLASNLALRSLPQPSAPNQNLLNFIFTEGSIPLNYSIPELCHMSESDDSATAIKSVRCSSGDIKVTMEVIDLQRRGKVPSHMDEKSELCQVARYIFCDMPPNIVDIFRRKKPRRASREFNKRRRRSTAAAVSVIRPWSTTSSTHEDKTFDQSVASPLTLELKEIINDVINNVTNKLEQVEECLMCHQCSGVEDSTPLHPSSKVPTSFNLKLQKVEEDYSDEYDFEPKSRAEQAKEVMKSLEFRYSDPFKNRRPSESHQSRNSPEPTKKRHRRSHSLDDKLMSTTPSISIATEEVTIEGDSPLLVVGDQSSISCLSPLRQAQIITTGSNGEEVSVIVPHSSQEKTLIEKVVDCEIKSNKSKKAKSRDKVSLVTNKSDDGESTELPVFSSTSIDCRIDLVDLFAFNSMSKFLCCGCYKTYDAKFDTFTIDLKALTLQRVCSSCSWLTLRQISWNKEPF